jgi:hypothetical protein
MKFIFIACLFLLSFANPLAAEQKTDAKTSGNLILSGWYADPEAIVFGKEYRIYPTYSDKAEKQLYFDAFSSIDLVKRRNVYKALTALCTASASVG